MPVFNLNNAPAFIRWPVNRGTTNADGETWTLYFANPGGYTITRLPDGGEDIVITDPFDLTGYTFGGSISVSTGSEPLCPVTWVDDDPTDGIAAMSIARTDLVDLTGHTYKFDIVKDLGLSTESTIILGTLTVTGRATA